MAMASALSLDNSNSSDLDEFDESEENSIFQQAAEFVQNQTTKPGGKQLDQKKMLEIYGFYKVATVGKCTDPKPGIFDLRGKAKWGAWMQVSDLSTAAATEGYINCVKEYYDWNPTVTSKKPVKTGCGGNSVSTMARLSVEDDEDLLEKDTIFAWAKDNSLSSIQSYLKGGNNPDVKDSEGLSPLHWAVDRGHLDACILLLNGGANLIVEDNDGQTPLDYAVTCEHQHIITLLEDRLNFIGN